MIKTPIKTLNKYFNYSYIFSPPTPVEQTYLQSKVTNVLQSKSNK